MAPFPNRAGPPGVGYLADAVLAAHAAASFGKPALRLQTASTSTATSPTCARKSAEQRRPRLRGLSAAALALAFPTTKRQRRESWT